MKSLIIYDENGEIWLVAHGATRVPKQLNCIQLNLADNAQIDRIDLAGSQPAPVYLEEFIDIENTLRKRMDAGEDLRKMISVMNLTDEEKWALEKRVKEG